MQIALAQINSHLGDFSYNKNLILKQIQKADDQNCDLIVFPEASLFGYHPVDLLERSSVVDQQLKCLDEIAQKMPRGLVALVGAITRNPKPSGKPYQNSAVLIRYKKKNKIFPKQLLPAYDVFDEGRHIEPGQIVKNTFTFKGKRVLVTICEDIWGWKQPEQERSLYDSNPLKKVKSKDCDLVLNLSASPFTSKKPKSRNFVCEKTVNHLKAPLVYANMVGAQDEIVFDGGSMVWDKKGNLIHKCAHFEEDFYVFKLEDLHKKKPQRLKKTKSIEAIHSALVLGIRDFVSKTGFRRVHLGLSGGIDSAVVLALAVQALKPKDVTAIALPGPFSSDLSFSLAKALAQNLEVQLHSIDIESIYHETLSQFESVIGKQEFSLLNESLQARIRGVLLMAFSNRHQSLVLNTGNKSEMATGYSTLYGDQVGGLCPIADLVKGKVFQLAEYINRNDEIIPKEIITRPPSAELRPNQKDSDSLPDYQDLDLWVEKLVEKKQQAKGVVPNKILRMLMLSEFKRWQAPPILKVTDHAFGRGRRLPIAHKAYY